MPHDVQLAQLGQRRRPSPQQRRWDVLGAAFVLRARSRPLRAGGTTRPRVLEDQRLACARDHGASPAAGGARSTSSSAAA